ncbi:MAG: hypothetical protein IKF82_01030 [Bacilli bacterium]|nr:hypothetical protein [Bacilli bacterium]
MNKYIRTENGIYRLYYNSETECYEVESDAFFIRIRGQIIISEAEIGNYVTANTIEALCDGFYNDVLNDFDCFGFDRLYIYQDFESFKEDFNSYRTYDNWKGNGYGFIKTNKGLIYVAKLNEKGKLELI